MKNYGKMISKQKSYPIHGPIIGVKPNGDPIYEYEDTVQATVYVNEDDIDMVVVLTADPSAYYIATDDNGIIHMGTDDPELIQVAGLNIIGVDSLEGHTVGEGGTIYHMKWTGTNIVDPVSLMTPDEKRALMPNLSARQIRLGLNSLGKLQMVDAAIAAMPLPQRTDAEIEWEYGTEFRRLHALIIMIIPLLELTPEEVDTAWMEFSTK